MNGAYYNEHDKFAAAWLRELIKKNLIAPGDVDERDIQQVKGSDLDGYTQVHFFAGIGGWSYALRLAGWPDDRPVWTGSCPCQPFSAAGKRQGEADARHLWPEMRRLIAERTPAIAFGEQVASDDGCQWLAGVLADLEELEYRVAGADLCAAGEGAPHIRQRIFWVAYAGSGACEWGAGSVLAAQAGKRGAGELNGHLSQRLANGGDDDGGLADTNESHTGQRGDARREAIERLQSGRDAHGCGEFGLCGVGIAKRGRLESGNERQGPTGAAWKTRGTVQDRFGKWRRIEPGIAPLAHGVPARVGRLRGYGNAIVPQVAARFIEASMMALEEA